MDEMQTAAETQDAEPATTEASSMSAEELARRGAIVAALVVSVIALFVAFQAVTDVIQTWLTPRWVPVWRALFALGVAGAAMWVVHRLTR